LNEKHQSLCRSYSQQSSEIDRLRAQIQELTASISWWQTSIAQGHISPQEFDLVPLHDVESVDLFPDSLGQVEGIPKENIAGADDSPWQSECGTQAIIAQASTQLHQTPNLTLLANRTNMPEPLFNPQYPWGS
jgi:hypothetical protein